MRSIALLTLMIFFCGLKIAAGETRYRDYAPIARGQLFRASLEFNLPVGGTDREFILPTPAELSGNDGGNTAKAAKPEEPNAPAQARPSESELCTSMLTVAQENGLPVPFFTNLIWQESNMQLDAVSSAGAQGIAQFMPEVAAEVGLANPFDPRQAIPASARFLHALRDQFHNLGYVAAAYNAGAHRVIDWLEYHRALPQETQTYVVRVTGHSAEVWRKSPPSDAEVTFVRPLPCRKLPAFAELEEAQMREARLMESQRPEKVPASEPPPERAAKTAAPKAAKRASPTQTAKAGKAESKIPRTLHILAERTLARGAERKLAHAEGPGKPVQNSHTGNSGGKHEVNRPPHAAHDKRRAA